MLKQIIIEKITSGRYFQTVALTATYCICIIGALLLAVKKITTVEVFLALFSGFTPMVILINEWYFQRTDRKPEGEKP